MSSDQNEGEVFEPFEKADCVARMQRSCKGQLVPQQCVPDSL